MTGLIFQSLSNAILWLVKLTMILQCICINENCIGPQCENLSHHMGKPTICIGENKGADQLRSYCEADQRLCFRYTDRTIPLLSKSKIIFCDCTARFVSDLVRNPNCWFSHAQAQIINVFLCFVDLRIMPNDLITKENLYPFLIQDSIQKHHWVQRYCTIVQTVNTFFTPL